jgi:hypothetical protein
VVILFGKNNAAKISVRPSEGVAVGIVIPHPKFSPPNPEFFGYLQSALNHYGFVPAIDIDQLIESPDKI